MRDRAADIVYAIRMYGFDIRLVGRGVEGEASAVMEAERRADYGGHSWDWRLDEDYLLYPAWNTWMERARRDREAA